MLEKTRVFKVSDTSTTYPILRNWGDLDQEQKDACYAQGYDEDHSLFWFVNGVAFSFEGDLHSLQGVFDCFGDYPYYLTYWGTTYIAKLNVVDGFTVSITLTALELQEND